MSEQAADRPEQSSNRYLQVKHDFISSLLGKEIVLNDTYMPTKLIQQVTPEKWFWSTAKIVFLGHCNTVPVWHVYIYICLACVNLLV